MKVAFETLGCRTNQLDSSSMAQDFIQAGWDVVPGDEWADIYVVNSCTVTHNGDADSRYVVNRIRKKNSEAKIILTGCYAQVAPEECSELEGVYLVAGNLEKHKLLEILEANLAKDLKNQVNTDKSRVYVENIMAEKSFIHRPIYSSLGKTRANLKIQDGCMYRCSFCIIPYARGNTRSNKIDNVLQQVNDLVQAGYQEVVLTGIHLGQFGGDLKDSTSLAKLLAQIEHIPNLKRYRLSSIGPMEITDELIDMLSYSKKFCRHLHISLQSGNDDILRAMRRPYKVAEYTQVINKVSEAIPDIAIGSDIIIGFPGETDNQFMDTYTILEKLPMTYIHVFTFSPRKGTPAYDMEEQVDDKTKKTRNKTLMTLASHKRAEFHSSFIGKTMNVLVENAVDKKTGLHKGLTDNYIKVLFEGNNEDINQIIPIMIMEANDKLAYGKKV